MAPPQDMEQSGTVASLDELRTRSAAHEVLEHQQQAASAPLVSQHDAGEPLPPSASTTESSGRQMESDDVPGPPPGSPPAAQASMGEEAGGPELQTSALFDASDVDGGPDAGEDSDQDTDTDSDVFSIRDPTSDADPW